MVRSPQDARHEHNVDLVFTGVRFASLRQSMCGVELHACTFDDLPLVGFPVEEDNPNWVWVLVSEGRRHYVIADWGQVEENDGEPGVPPVPWPWQFVSAQTVATVSGLVHDFGQLTPLLEEHLKDNNDGLLPNQFLRDVMWWLVDHADSERDYCRSVLAWLDREYELGSAEVRELIEYAGGLVIPGAGGHGSVLLDLLGPALRAAATKW